MYWASSKAANHGLDIWLTTNQKLLRPLQTMDLCSVNVCHAHDHLFSWLFIWAFWCPSVCHIQWLRRSMIAIVFLNTFYGGTRFMNYPDLILPLLTISNLGMLMKRVRMVLDLGRSPQVKDVGNPNNMMLNPTWIQAWSDPDPDPTQSNPRMILDLMPILELTHTPSKYKRVYMDLIKPFWQPTTKTLHMPHKF